MPNGGRCEPGGDSTGGSVQRGRWRVNTLYAEGSTRWTPALTLWSSKRNSQRKNIGMAIPHVTARRSPWTTPVQPPAGSPAPARGYGHVRAAGHTCRSAPPRFNSQLTFHPMTSFVLPKNAALSFSLVLQLHRRHAPDVICGAPREREIRLCEELERTLLRSAKPAACAQIRVGLVLVGCGHRVERANECVCRHPRLHLPSLDVVVLAHRMRQQLFHRPLLPPTQRRAQREQRPGGAEGVREEAAAATYF
jgi:hypothetical protein